LSLLIVKNTKSNELEVAYAPEKMGALELVQKGRFDPNPAQKANAGVGCQANRG
jgi:hypothetical protein